MSKEELLRQMRLLSALESVLMQRDARCPDYLFENLADCVSALEREILK